MDMFRFRIKCCLERITDSIILILSPCEIEHEATPIFGNGGSKNTKILSLVSVPKKSIKNGRGKAYRQILASIVACIGNMNTGMVFGFTATVLPQLKGQGSSIKITDDEASWIASLSAVGTPVGCILSGYLMDRVGRRPTLILTEVPLVLGWTLIAAAHNVEMIYIGRLLVGLGSGMVSAPSGVYTCEVTQPYLRGVLGALAAVSVSFGVLLQYVIGSFTTWNVLASINVIVPVVALLGMTLLPETPNYLLSRGHKERASNALIRLRGSTCDVEREMEQMLTFKEKNCVDAPKTVRELIKALLSPSALKPFGILTLYFFVYVWSGVIIVTFHAVEVFQESGTEIDTHLLAICMGATRLIFTTLGCVLCRRFGRRPLTFLSASGCGICMLVLSAYMYWTKRGGQVEFSPLLSLLPVACIFGYIVFCTLGFLTIPWLMIGEVYPTQVRGIMGGLTTCMAHLSIFSVVKTYDFQKQLLNDYGAFALYGTLSLFGLVFFYFFLPETKGKTLQEIEDYFCGLTKALNKNSTCTLSGS